MSGYQGSFSVFSLYSYLLHEFELGVWKAIFTHILQILHTVGGTAVQELNWRYCGTPTFGRGTIHQFHVNVSAMKWLVAHNFEDLLQINHLCNSLCAVAEVTSTVCNTSIQWVDSFSWWDNNQPPVRLGMLACICKIAASYWWYTTFLQLGNCCIGPVSVSLPKDSLFLLWHIWTTCWVCIVWSLGSCFGIKAAQC